MCNSARHVIRTHRHGVRALIEPTVPGILDGGLIPVSLLEAPLPVTFPVWDDAIDNDYYQLVLDGVVIGTRGMLPLNPVPGTELSLDIPLEVLADLNDGVHKLGYLSQRFVGGTPNDSPEIDIILDRAVPGGGGHIAPLIFPPLVYDGLTSQELTDLGDVLPGEVAPYFGIAAGDLIQTFWGTTEGPQHTVIPAEVPGGGTAPSRIIFNFTRAFLEALGDVKEDVYYTIVDRAGNGPVQSDALAFQLSLSEPTVDLPMPIIPQADDGVISDMDARSSVEVSIPDYGDVRVGDLVRLFWGNNSIPLVPVEPGDENQDPVFILQVTYGTIALTPDGLVDVRYEVQRNGAPFGQSLAKEVNVLLALPGPDEPGAPIIRGRSGNPDAVDNVIDEDDYLLPATAVIPWKTGYVLDDQINLFWGNQATPVVHSVTQSDINNARDLELSVPNSLIVAEGTGRDIGVRYTITHANNPNTRTSAQQSVIVRNRGELPGGEDGLNAPQFLRLTENNGIGAILNPDGASCIVRPYVNIKEGDVLTFFFKAWTGFVEGPALPEADYTFITEPLTEQQTREDYEFIVPDWNLRRICVGRCEATFKVDSITGPATSAPARVLIDMVTPGEGCHGTN